MEQFSGSARTRLFGRSAKKSSASARDRALIEDWLKTHKPTKCPPAHAIITKLSYGTTMDLSAPAENAASSAGARQNLAIANGYVWNHGARGAE